MVSPSMGLPDLSLMVTSTMTRLALEEKTGVWSASFLGAQEQRDGAGAGRGRG